MIFLERQQMKGEVAGAQNADWHKIWLMGQGERKRLGKEGWSAGSNIEKHQGKDIVVVEEETLKSAIIKLWANPKGTAKNGVRGTVDGITIHVN